MNWWTPDYAVSLLVLMGLCVVVPVIATRRGPVMPPTPTFDQGADIATSALTGKSFRLQPTVVAAIQFVGGEQNCDEVTHFLNPEDHPAVHRWVFNHKGVIIGGVIGGSDDEFEFYDWLLKTPRKIVIVTSDEFQALFQG